MARGLKGQGGVGPYRDEGSPVSQHRPVNEEGNLDLRILPHFPTAKEPGETTGGWQSPWSRSGWWLHWCVRIPSGELRNNVLGPLRVHQPVYRRKITDTNTFFIRKADHLPPLGSSPRQSRRHAECPGWTPGPAGLRKQQLPQVGQAGVVPQSLREGLCSFIPDSVAPHPEDRAKRVNVSLCAPLTFCRWPRLLCSPRQRSLGALASRRLPHQPLSEAALGFQCEGKRTDKSSGSLGNRSPSGSCPVRRPRYPWAFREPSEGLSTRLSQKCPCRGYGLAAA